MSTELPGAVDVVATARGGAGPVAEGYEQQAPAIQMMPGNLEAIDGVVIREVTQIADMVLQGVGIPYEQANKYEVKQLPAGVTAASDFNQPGWLPSKEEIKALPEVFFINEESSACDRVCMTMLGCLNLRALKLHFYQNNQQTPLMVDRPCKVGGGCCCPLELTLTNNGQMVGMVVEDFDNYCGQCCAQTCACTYTQKVMVGSSRESLVHKYSLVNSYCCFGRVNNCCGGTCCKPNFFIDVMSPEGKFINAVQMTYGSGGAEDCCRMGAQMNNYVMTFPPGSSHWERLMLLTGIMSVEYAYHSRKGDENN
ncbi:hypothetical protein HYH02_006846 [Chlamydomonas schloesseri]|uniref:Phospholipid scramblase n=1 Tax=Chlamydomonas schloesseri TaxID=2026947 RepID=A0A835WIZ8_9CHLO|nr:hypothetical protein HYH02_006846 [Chlamydomonas schloesseri]|eukprot:KAG2448262.1 hypothetical protein HYH02_006846 [Chlamydomonas schloesseri]